MTVLTHEEAGKVILQRLSARAYRRAREAFERSQWAGLTSPRLVLALCRDAKAWQEVAADWWKEGHEE